MAGLKKCLFVAASLAFAASAVYAGDAVDDAGKASVSHGWSVNADYPTTGVAEIDNDVAKWVGKNIREHLKDASNVSVDPSHPGDDWDMTMDYITSQPSDRAVSFVFETVVSPEGAAHPMTYIDVLSYDARNGHELDLGDIFGRPKVALQLMARLAPERVAEDIRDNAPELFAHLTDDAFVVKGFEPNEENYASLVLVPEGVLVIFQRYQVLPYAYGNPEAFFSLDELQTAQPRLELWGQE